MTAPHPARQDGEPPALWRAIDRIAARRLRAAKGKASRPGKGNAKGRGARRPK